MGQSAALSGPSEPGPGGLHWLLPQGDTRLWAQEERGGLRVGLSSRVLEGTCLGHVSRPRRQHEREGGVGLGLAGPAHCPQPQAMRVTKTPKDLPPDLPSEAPLSDTQDPSPDTRRPQAEDHGGGWGRGRRARGGEVAGEGDTPSARPGTGLLVQHGLLPEGPRGDPKGRENLLVVAGAALHPPPLPPRSPLF